MPGFAILSPMKAFLFFCSAACLLGAAPAPPTLRLGDQVQPKSYMAQLTLDPDKDTFSGTIEIAIAVKEPTSLIWLNAVDLQIDSATIAAQKATIVTGSDNFVGFSFERQIPIGFLALAIQYRGKLSIKSNEGLFRQKQDNRNYIFTQFESVSARRAFPCFDEPGFKTPWQITLKIPGADLGFSNTSPESEATGADGMKTIRFQPTKPLPSYLIAIAVGPLEVVDAGTSGRNHTPIRIIVPHGRSRDARYAAKTIPQLLNLLETYFDIAYPYPKLDSVAVPLFLGYAMENAGLITYDDPIILSNPDRESIAFQRGFASVAAHEMAHQWFGDLVTMAWWNDTWLNEAFATWMSSHIVDNWKPEWHAEIDDLRGRLFAASQDGLASARRITQPVESKSDIANAFDSITYQKGGAVIGMFEANAGPEKFRKGVHAYLNAHSYGNARTEDFLDALGKAAGPAIVPAFRTFLDQPGIPEVTVAVDCPAKGKPVATITQKRSQPLGAELPAETWAIPVCLKYGTSGPASRQCETVKTASARVTLSAAKSCPAWVLPNAGAAGYYRVNYPGDSLRQLLERGGNQLSLVEQASVLSDALALTGTGALPAESALSIVPLMASKPERDLVSGARQIVVALAGFLPDDLFPNRERFIRKTFGPRAHQLGWVGSPGETDDTRLLREELLTFVARSGQDKELIAAAHDLAIKWLDDHKTLPSGMVGPVLSAAAVDGDRNLYERYRSAALASKDQQEQETIINAMGTFRDPEIVRLAVGESLKSDFDIRISLNLLFARGSVPATRDIPVTFVKAHFDELIAKAPSFGDADFSAFLPFVAMAGCSEAEEADAKAFFGPRVAKSTGGPRNIAQVLESIHSCAAQKAKQQDSLRAFYSKY